MMRMSVVEGDIDSAFHFFCSCVAQDTTMQHVSKEGLLHNFVTVKDGLVSLEQTANKKSLECCLIIAIKLINMSSSFFFYGGWLGG